MTLKNATDPTTRAIYHYILRAFADTGLPPSLESIITALNLSDRATGERYLASIEVGGGIYRDQASGRILSAYPFSAVPTSHRVTLAGHPQVYAMCAFDALGMPFMLDTDAVIDSHCQQCSKPVTLHITNKTISTVAPREITVVYANAPANCCAATDQCPYINFFCSPAHAHAWQADQSHLTSKSLTLAEAMDVGRSIFEDLLRPLEGDIQR